MHAKQQRVDSLNYFNVTVFVLLMPLSFYNQTRRFIYRCGAYFDDILFAISTSNSQLN